MTITLSAVQIFLGLATLVGGAGTIGAVVSAGVQWSRVYCCAAFEDYTVQTTRATWDDLVIEDLS